MTTDSLSHAIVLLFVEGFLLCGFLATFDYAPEADAGNRQNSFSPHLNGKPSSLPVTYTRKFLDSLFFTAPPYPLFPLIRLPRPPLPPPLPRRPSRLSFTRAGCIWFRGTSSGKGIKALELQNNRSQKICSNLLLEARETFYTIITDD